MLYAVTPKVLELAAKPMRRTRRRPSTCSRQFGSANAIAWQQEWLKLGDTLLGKYAMGTVDGQTSLPAVVERPRRLQAARQ